MRRTPALLLAALLPVACAPSPTDTSVDDTDTDAAGGTSGYVVGSIVITDSGRTMYVQVVDALTGHLDNRTAIEVPGNALLESVGGHVFVGLVEEPTWIRYALQDGQLVEDGRVSFGAYGWPAIDYGNTFVRDDLAVSVSTSLLEAILWDPSTMTVIGNVDLSVLHHEGYGVEVFPVTDHDGLVYIPGRHVDWEQGQLEHEAMLVVLDPDAAEVTQVLRDDRCPVTGRMVFDPDGVGYVMADGRNYSIQMFARARGDTDIPRNCFLRLQPGADAFDVDWSPDVMDLTGGHESLTALETADGGSGIGFAKVFYEDELPDDVAPVDFSFWGYPMARMWRFDLRTDPPTAAPVDGLPLSGIGFSSVPLDGELLSGETTDGATTTVFAIDPETATSREMFTMDGYFYGAFRL
ncbi:MAG: hypothetical protein H6733_03920 [Alphaproteobacteria bacterium]|nr:hypothetical protein [Alphaproteobacteria bacterium]